MDRGGRKNFSEEAGLGVLCRLITSLSISPEWIKGLKNRINFENKYTIT